MTYNVTPHERLTVRDAKGHWWKVVQVSNVTAKDMDVILMGEGDKSGELGWVNGKGEGVNHTTKEELNIPCFGPPPAHATGYLYANQYDDGRWGMLYADPEECRKMQSSSTVRVAVPFMEGGVHI